MDLTSGQQHVELAHGIPAALAFKIVLGAEQALPSGLALAARDGAEGIGRRAMVLRKRFSAFTSVAMGRNSGGWA